MSDTEEEIQSRTIKITVVGEPLTGKSSLCHRYLGTGGAGGAGGAGGTQGAEVLAGQCALRPHVTHAPHVPLQLCDVAGAARDTLMLDNYLYASDIVIFVYDLTNLQSFDKLKDWFDRVQQIFQPQHKKPLLALFGNKSDLEHQRAVRLSCVQKFASEHLLENFKGSARTGEMVNDTFTSLVARVLGIKSRPPLANGKVPASQDLDLITSVASKEPPNALIMNRKALRKLQRSASSSVCCVQ